MKTDIIISKKEIVNAEEYKTGLEEFENVKKEIYNKNLPVTVYADFHTITWTKENIVLSYKVVYNLKYLKFSDIHKLQVIFRKIKYKAFSISSKNAKVVLYFVKNHELV